MRALLIAAACALVLLRTPPASGQEGGVNFVAEPVPGSQTDPARGFFLLAASPGAKITQAIGLRNDSAGPLQIQLAAVDAGTAKMGGASYALANQRPTRTGAWITLERTNVTLPANASAVVPFRVSVPAGAESGHHLAGISVSVPKAQGDPAEAGSDQAGISVDVQTRRVLAVQVNLPGPADPELVIGDVSPVARPDGLHLEIAIENKGRGLTKAKGVINVGTDFRRDFEVDTFVPRTSITYPVKWTTQAQAGPHPTRVELRYGERTARWEGTFTVGEEVLQELADRQVNPTQAPEEEEGPKILVAALIATSLTCAVLLSAAALGVSRRRRRRDQQGSLA